MKGYGDKRWKGFRLRLLPEADHLTFLDKCCGNDIKNDPDFKPVSSSAYARVYRFEMEGRSYYYKQFLSRNAFEPLKNLIRGDRALRSLKGDFLLHDKGFKVPKCMLIGKKGRQIFMVSEAVDNGKDLIRYVKEEFPHGMSPVKISEKRELCKLLGIEIGKLHAEGIIHGDLRWGNVVIEKRKGFAPGIWFLDNERTIASGVISEKLRLVNLVQMNMIPPATITFTDRMRFYKAYLSQNPDLMPEKRSLAEKILQKTAIRFNRKAARLISQP